MLVFWEVLSSAWMVNIPVFCSAFNVWKSKIPGNPSAFELSRGNLMEESGTAGNCTIWRVGTSKCPEKRSENARANEDLSCTFPSIPGIALGVAPRIVVFVLLKSWDAIPRMGMPFQEWSFVFRESVSEFRELLREYPGTLRELREWPFHSESVFAWNWGGPHASKQTTHTQNFPILCAIFVRAISKSNLRHEFQICLLVCVSFWAQWYLGARRKLFRGPLWHSEEILLAPPWHCHHPLHPGHLRPVVVKQADRFLKSAIGTEYNWRPVKGRTKHAD